MNRVERNALVVANLPLVGYLVSDLCSRASHLSRDDLASVGAIALITSADAFDASLGVPFGAYARRRIVGAFADQMRSDDWASRTARRRIKETLAIQETLTASLGRTPSVAEVASALGVDRESAAEALADASRNLTSLDDTIADYLAAATETPEETVLREERTRVLRAVVEALPERMRYIIEQVYFAERSVKELAEEFGITHSAVSQQRTEAIRMMRVGLAERYSDDSDGVDEAAVQVAPVRREAYLSRLSDRLGFSRDLGLEWRSAAS